MAKKIKITRKELLKEPDQFLSSSEKAMLFFTENRSAVVGGILIILIAGLSYFGYENYKLSQIMKNEALYYNMLEIAKAEEKETEKLLKMRNQIGNGSQRNRASLLIADAYFKNNNYDQAEEIYREIIKNSKGLNHSMATIGLAYTYEAKGDFNNAISLYKSVIDINTVFPLFQVYWSLARCHVNDNDKSKALLVLREMQIKFTGTNELEKIERRIKQLST